jgi:hypothetical protein
VALQLLVEEEVVVVVLGEPKIPSDDTSAVVAVEEVHNQDSHVDFPVAWQ